MSKQISKIVHTETIELSEDHYFVLQKWGNGKWTCEVNRIDAYLGTADGGNQMHTVIEAMKIVLRDRNY